MRRTTILIAVVLLAGGGIVARIAEIRQQSAFRGSAALLFSAFDAEPELNDVERRALVQLSKEGYGVRAAFLRLGLENTGNATRFVAHRHAFSVALSQVDRRNTHALFEQGLLPLAKQSQDPVALRAIFDLIQGWGILPSLPQAARDDLGLVVADRIVADSGTQARTELMGGLRLWSAQLSPAAAGQVTEKIVTRLLRETDPPTGRSLTVAMQVSVPETATAKADALAQQVLSAMLTSFNAQKLSFLVSALRQLGGRVSPDMAGKAAEEIVARLVFKRDVLAQGTWAEALGSLKGIPDATARKLATELLTGIEEDSSPLPPFFTALSALAGQVTPDEANSVVRSVTRKIRSGDAVGVGSVAAAIGPLVKKADRAQIDEARSAVQEALRSTSEARSAVSLAYVQAALSEGQPQGANDASIGKIAALLRDQQDPYVMDELVDALTSLAKTPMHPAGAVSAANVLLDRITQEHGIPALTGVMGGFLVLAKQVPETDDDRIAARLVERMVRSDGGAALRALAFGVGSLKAAPHEKVIAAAEKLRSNALFEDDPAALRALAAGLLNLSDDIPRSYFQSVIARAEQLRKANPTGRGVQDLDAIVRALQARASEPHGKSGEVQGGRKDDDDDPKDVSMKADDVPNHPAAAVNDETAVRQIVSPLLDEPAWYQLTLRFVPIAKVAKVDDGDGDDDDDETLADFHTLIVLDDDGETGGRSDVTFPLDFNGLSDALDHFRQPATARRPFEAAEVGGIGSAVAGLLLLLLACYRWSRSSRAPQDGAALAHPAHS